uniref:Tr-type G domain-containing protein n=1 Tax=Paramoeba aestuarina TaxID=180227 RepID=A0A7S4KQ77_9EUKA|mmetsp:Transcript_23267/g.36275  ORF Transcript_23267/g.36275 Transcript_23267/m.36275 type:complete len:535 (+) Transcript_23267:13-1617(+)
MNCTFNVNVGLFGHIDAGKTAIAKSLSETLSTACFDKHPESRERGITIDLGFSAFKTESPGFLRRTGYNSVQYTIVDCPGHADFIRTIIGGAEIIDVMLIVIDINKGIQTQTSECIIIGEILNKPMIILLNKVDLIRCERDRLDDATRKISHRLKSTRLKNPKMILLSTKRESPFFTDGFATLHATLQDMTADIVQSRAQSELKHLGESPILVYTDHCFPIKGKGSIVTGTVLQGSLHVDQLVEMPSLKIRRNIKSMQSFHAEIRKASIGDRVGICFKDIPAERIERTYITSVNSRTICFSKRIIMRVQRVRYYSKSISFGNQFHISLGHSSSVARVKFIISSSECFDKNAHYTFLHTLPEDDNVMIQDACNLTEGGIKKHEIFLAIVDFPRPLLLPKRATALATKLDSSLSLNSCRIAFFGTVCFCFEAFDVNQTVKISAVKRKELFVDRWIDATKCICKGLANNHTKDASHFVGESVQCFYGDSEGVRSTAGKINDTFGQSGKVKVVFENPIRIQNSPDLKIFMTITKTKRI